MNGADDVLRFANWERVSADRRFINVGSTTWDH
jgi:hypothetical protein